MLKSKSGIKNKKNSYNCDDDLFNVIAKYNINITLWVVKISEILTKHWFLTSRQCRQQSKKWKKIQNSQKHDYVWVKPNKNYLSYLSDRKYQYRCSFLISLC